MQTLSNANPDSVDKCSDVKKRFGRALKQLRAQSGITQDELAWRAELHRTYISDIERGARNLSLQSIEKLAKALNVSFSTLFQPLDDSPDLVGRALSAGEKDDLVES